MKVKCITNRIDERFTLDTAARLKRYISVGESELDIEIGREYIVYGIELWDNYPWVYIFSESYDEYPKPFALDFLKSLKEKSRLTGSLSHNTHITTKSKHSSFFANGLMTTAFMKNWLTKMKNASRHLKAIEKL